MSAARTSWRPRRGRGELPVDRRRWRRVRREVLDRDGWRCRTCGRAGRLEVDHVVPLEWGGAPYDAGNCQALCRPCHFAKTAAEAAAKRPPDAGREAWAELVAELR